jgi:hypothetical protein
MSLVGRKIAVVSLGICCQATFQIRHHAKLLARLSGDATAAISGMPFDGLICPPESAAKMLREDKFYPLGLDDLAVSQGAYWTDFNVYFWHEFRPGKLDSVTRRKINVEKSHRVLREKYRHMADKFRRLSQVERLIFVICNTQNNLPLVADLTGTVSPRVDLETIDALAAQGDAFFGRPCEYVVATYPDWASGQSTRKNVTVHELSRDKSDWQGDPAQWERVFKDTFARAPASFARA